MPPDATARVPLSFPLDLELTLGALQRGRADPTIRFDTNQVWRAARTPDGPATVRLSRVGAGLTADAWGAAAGHALLGGSSIGNRAPAFCGHPGRRVTGGRPGADGDASARAGQKAPDEPARNRSLVCRRSLGRRPR